MRTRALMVAACVATWLVMAALVTPDVAIELLLGMVAPLAVALATMSLVEHTYTRDPRRLTPLMIKTFGTKMVLFGLYTAIVVGLAPVDPVPFVASFATYFIGLHLTEALWLRSLFGTKMS